jgi:hypothetical protein
MGVRKWLEKSAEKQKHKLRKTLNPLSRKAFQAVSFSATKDTSEQVCMLAPTYFLHSGEGDGVVISLFFVRRRTRKSAAAAALFPLPPCSVLPERRSPSLLSEFSIP